MTNISVTRALATIKNLDAKIERAIPSLQLVTLSAGTGGSLALADTKLTVEEFSDKVKSAEKALTDMIKQRTAIKNAVIQSNATTKVTVGDKEMTVAEAIETKKSIGFKVQLLANLRKQLVTSTSAYTRANDAFQQKLESAEASVSTRDKKATDEEIKLATQGIKLRQTPAIVDPLNLSKYIETLEVEVQDFLLNVDFALSEINAKTEITIQ